MKNKETQRALAYHSSTKHPGMPPHEMDWKNQPLGFKVYTGLEPIGIPTDFPLSDFPALAAVGAPGTGPPEECARLDFPTLARVLFLSAGITRKVDYGGNLLYFRAAACTGALYHIDLYAVTGDMAGLRAGVYQFDPRDFSLKMLREGDFRALLGGGTEVAKAPASIVLASTFWRNSWKYQARAYRHVFWDSGTILSNTLAAARAYGLEAAVMAGFIDQEVSRLLDLNPTQEAAVCIVPLGTGDPGAPEPSPPASPLSHTGHRTLRLSRQQTTFPSITSMHSASSLEGRKEVEEWKKAVYDFTRPEPTHGAIALPTPPHPHDGTSIEQTIVNRASTREFSTGAIDLPTFSSILYHATRGIPADFLPVAGSFLNDIYILVNAVEGIGPGAYHYHGARHALELLHGGEMRRKAREVALGQDLAGDAAFDVFFMTGLDGVLEAYGNRGYRAAQLEGGILGGKMYLAAHSLGLGATGLTFFDDDVTEIFSPHASQKSAMFLLAAGKPAA